MARRYQLSAGRGDVRRDLDGPAARALSYPQMRAMPPWLLNRRAVLVATAVGLAALLTACSGTWAPAAVAIPSLIFFVAGIVVLAWKAGWVTLPLLTVSVVAVGAISSALFYDDQANVPPDLRVSGMDEIGRDPGSVVIALPFMWLLLLLTLAVRYRRWQAGRKPVEETSIYP